MNNNILKELIIIQISWLCAIYNYLVNITLSLTILIGL